MKTLLVCTDFSEAANHAASYACMLAQQYKLKHITLFHAWHSIITTAALPLSANEEAEHAKAALLQLQKLRDDLISRFNSEIEIRIRAEKLSLYENINKLCEEEKADMIVLGVTGKSKVERLLLVATRSTFHKTADTPF